MRNLIQRTVTGVVFVLLIILSILAGQIYFAALFLIITVIGLWEFYSLIKLRDVTGNKFAGIIAGTFLFASNALIALNLLPREVIHINFLFIFLIFLLELYRKDPNPFTNIAFTFFGVLYVAVPFTLLNYLPNPGLENNTYMKYILIGFFILVWVNETGAYVVGMSIGRTKLFERISPNKTWEGVIGGGILSLTAAFIMSYFFKGITLIDWLVISSIIIVFGTYGDLFESMFKRSIKTKDSGALLPGHGGVLDRFDGVFMAAPFVYVYLLLIF
ncbi:MAG: phosphatidate cytidylyltransferase [Bacteroidota bacterium]